MKILTIAAQKGGTGKTTTAAALAQAAASKGKNVLVLDLDPQGSLSNVVGADTTRPGSYDLLKGTPAANLIQSIEGQPDVIPGDLRLSGADTELANRPGRDFILCKSLESLQNRYDLIIIDTPPALGTLLINALTAATHAIIPLQADLFALQSLDQLADTINQVKQYTNPSLQITGALLTRYNGRTVLTKELTESIAAKCDSLGIPLHKAIIRENIAVKEAQVMQQSLYTYAPRSNAAQDYMNLYTELED